MKYRTFNIEEKEILKDIPPRNAKINPIQRI